MTETPDLDQHPIVTKLRAWKPEAIAETLFFRGETTLIVPREWLRRVADYLASEPDLVADEPDVEADEPAAVADVPADDPVPASVSSPRPESPTTVLVSSIQMGQQPARVVARDE